MPGPGRKGIQPAQAGGDLDRGRGDEPRLALAATTRPPRRCPLCIGGSVDRDAAVDSFKVSLGLANDLAAAFGAL